MPQPDLSIGPWLVLAIPLGWMIMAIPGMLLQRRDRERFKQ